jgi:ankyrin repeat protein
VLLEYGVDADKPRRSRTPLEIAAAFGECLIVELLVANGATPAGSDALHVAAAAWHNDVLKLLLGKPASASTRHLPPLLPSSFTFIDMAGRDGKNPLWLAAEGGCRDTVKTLLAASARADARCGTNFGAALHAAARRDDETVTRLILAHGTASVRGAKGKTACEATAKARHLVPSPELVAVEGPRSPSRFTSSSTRVVRPVDEDLYHVPPLELAYHRRRRCSPTTGTAPGGGAWMNLVGGFGERLEKKRETAVRKVS